MKTRIVIAWIFFALFPGLKAVAQYCNADLTNGIAAANITTNSGTGSSAFDNVISTQWTASAATGYLQVDLGSAAIVTYYSITSSTQSSTFDPKNFSLQGSNDGSTFTTLDTRTAQSFATRSLTVYYNFSNTIAYRYYKLNITTNNGGAKTSIAEMQLLPSSACVLGNVYNTTAGVGYPSVSVFINNLSGTVSSVTTNASGQFSFSTTQTPSTDFTVLVQPPANTYFYSGPAMNLNVTSANMTPTMITNTKAELWPNGAFLNVNGATTIAPSTYPYLIDNTQGAQTPSSLNWVLKPSTPYTVPACTTVTTTLDGSGTFGTLSKASFVSEHPWQPIFHQYGLVAYEQHPNLFKALTSATSTYNYSDALTGAAATAGILTYDGTYTITSFIGTVEDATFLYNSPTDMTGNNVTNSYASGWRKTYGHTTGDAYDQFLAVNGSTSTVSTLLKFTGNIATSGTYYLNFFGKNANSYNQVNVYGINTPVQLVLTVYNGSGTLVSTSNLTLPVASSTADDLPTSAWVGSSSTFTASTTGTYTFKLNVPTTSSYGNDFYIDDIIVSQCPIVTLPVVLSNFTATLQNNISLLRWTTETEINVKEFVVQRSADGINWNTIGTVNATGNSNLPVDYTFEDENITSGIYYYRLSIIDIDGENKFSNICVVTKQSTNQITVFPNPVTNNLYITTSDWSQIAQIKLTDITGADIFHSQNVQQNIPMSQLSNGVYILYIYKTDESVETKKVIKK
jgi:hypothetical protein